MRGPCVCLALPTFLCTLGDGIVSCEFPPCRVSVSLLKTLDQMLANGCLDIFTKEEK